MRNRKFMYGFLAFDIVLIMVIAIFLIVKNPFKRKVAPNTEATSQVTVSAPSEATEEPQQSSAVVHVDTPQIFTTMPDLVGMREESTLTDDGNYYTSYKASLDLDMDGDGQIESVSISLDDHSESFYVLINDNGQLLDFVVPGLEYGYKDQYSCKACKGALQSYTADLDVNDHYQEVAVELNRDTWMECKTIVVRYDGSHICVSAVPGKLSGVSNAGEVQFYEYDYMTGQHKIYRTYALSSDIDFLRPETDYFVDTEVEQTSLVTSLNEDLVCINSYSEETTIPAGTPFYWYFTDNESYVQVITTDGSVYQLAVETEEVVDANNTQTIYRIAGHLSSDFLTK